MSDDVVGDIEGLDFAFVPVEEILADVWILACGVRNPRNIGCAKKVSIHRIGFYGFFEPLRAGAVLVEEPDLGNNQFSVPEGHGIDKLEIEDWRLKIEDWRLKIGD